jgi:hypothetical protein
MSDFLSRYAHQLALAERTLQAAPAPTPRHFRPRRRGALLAFAALALSVPALAATSGWQPWAASQDATHPIIVRSSVPRDQRAILAVLRRPQTAADRSAAVASVLAVVGRDPFHLGLRPGSVRNLGPSPDGPRHAIVLASVTNQSVGTYHGITVHGPAVCVWYPAGVTRWSVGGKCSSAYEIEGGLAGGMSFSRRSGEHLWGLVPDGVASVTVTLRGGKQRTGRVRSNFYDIAVAASSELRRARGPLFPENPRPTFRDSEGMVIATPATLRARYPRARAGSPGARPSRSDQSDAARDAGRLAQVKPGHCKSFPAPPGARGREVWCKPARRRRP